MAAGTTVVAMPTTMKRRSGGPLHLAFQKDGRFDPLTLTMSVEELDKFILRLQIARESANLDWAGTIQLVAPESAKAQNGEGNGSQTPKVPAAKNVGQGKKNPGGRPKKTAVTAA